jgi:hypothetical protein
MATNLESNAPTPKPATSQESVRRRRLVRVLLGIILLWAAVAYLVVPRLWKAYFRHHGDLNGVARITQTSDGHPGDPINLALVGTEAEVVRAMTAAGWFPADPITFQTSVRIAVDSVFRRPDNNAPVSSLYLFGRKQDLAFEQPVGNSPRQRHHVRFWRSDQKRDDRPVWFGSATFDERVGLSYTTGQVTHHIGPDVDAERDRIAREIEKTGWDQGISWVNGFHAQREGRNGGGDPWRTDGRLAVVTLALRSSEPLVKTNGASAR